MKLKKYINLFVIEVLQLKFWLLYGLIGTISVSFLKREQYDIMGMSLAISTMMGIYILFIFQMYEKEKSPLGISLFLTTSYTRKDIIYSRYFTYFSFIVIITIINLANTIYGLNYPEIFNFSFFTETILFKFTLIFVLVPISFKCDTGNSFALKSFIFFLPYEILCCEISNRINKINIDSQSIFILTMVLILLLFIISVNFSKRIFLKKDL